MDEEKRTGVFVCDCGSNILSVVDVPAVVEYAKGLEGVVFADEGRWSCSVDSPDRGPEPGRCGISHGQRAGNSAGY